MSTRVITYRTSDLSMERQITVKIDFDETVPAFPISVLLDGGLLLRLSKELALSLADAIIGVTEEVDDTHKITGYPGEVIEDEITCLCGDPDCGFDCKEGEEGS